VGHTAIVARKVAGTLRVPWQRQQYFIGFNVGDGTRSVPATLWHIEQIGRLRKIAGVEKLALTPIAVSKIIRPLHPAATRYPRCGDEDPAFRTFHTL
jgi:hypothetical protein